jgi:hypothetical protein
MGDGGPSVAGGATALRNIWKQKGWPGIEPTDERHFVHRDC